MFAAHLASQGTSGSISLSDYSVYAPPPGVGAALAGYQLTSGGYAQRKINTGSYSDVEQYCFGAASDFEVKAEYTGDTPTGTFSTWLALSSTRTWTMVNGSPGILTADITLEIRDVATSTIQDTATITLSAEDV
jgi:hypothetical protein